MESEYIRIPMRHPFDVAQHTGHCIGDMTTASSPTFLRAGEQLVRLHYYRFFSTQGCALGSVDIVVEEALGPEPPAAARCAARPQHARLVTRPEYIVRAESVDAALQQLVERLRSRPLTDAFLPTH
jgi:hypothetical protein